MTSNEIQPQAAMEAEDAQTLIQIIREQSVKMQEMANNMTEAMMTTNSDAGFFLTGLTIFILACFVGYYVVWKVTPALHSPLMSVTNAISSIIILGGILAVGAVGGGFSGWLGFFAIILASINIFGGFVITQRMLSMFKKKGD
jgi:NAD(P) transhydrogenase subunit alpha